MWPRVQASYLVVNLLSRIRPLNLSVFFCDSRCECGLGFILILLGDASFGKIIDTSNQEAGAYFSESGFKGLCSVIVGDRNNLLLEHRPGIHLFDQFDDRNACFGFAGHDCPLNWRGPTIFREQRGVDIDRSEWRKLQQAIRKELPICHHDT